MSTISPYIVVYWLAAVTCTRSESNAFLIRKDQTFPARIKLPSFTIRSTKWLLPHISISLYESKTFPNKECTPSTEILLGTKSSYPSHLHLQYYYPSMAWECGWHGLGMRLPWPGNEIKLITQLCITRLQIELLFALQLGLHLSHEFLKSHGLC